MILPDDVKPELSIYYIGGMLIKVLQKNKKYNIDEIFMIVHEKFKVSYKTSYYSDPPNSKSW